MTILKWIGVLIGALILTHWLSAGADDIVRPDQLRHLIQGEYPDGT